MPDDPVAKVAAKIDVDVSPAEAKFRQLGEAYKSAFGDMAATLQNGAKISGDMSVQWLDGVSRTLKQQIQELKTQYKEGLLSAQDFYDKLSGLQKTYAQSLNPNTSIGFSNDQTMRRALIDAQAEIQKFEDFKFESDNRMLQNEVNDWIEAERQYVNMLEQEQAAHEKSINDRLKLIKTFYDTKVVTAKDSLAQIETLMTEETDFFQENVDKRITAMKMQYQIQKDQAAQAARDQAALSNSRSFNLGPLSNIGRYSVDIAGGMALFTVMEELTKIPQAAMAAQNSMTKLEQVLELGPSQTDLQRFGSLNGILQQLEQTAEVMAQTYGVDVNKVIDAMSMIGRKYKDTADIITLTDTALQMNAVDNVDVQTSVQSLEAMMSQFHLTTGQARQALFELTAAAHEFQVTGTDLMDAIDKSGASFATLKMNTEESIAAISALGQMTAQSGNVIGNSWKSIEASMMSDKGVKALQQMGIAAYDANGNLKDGVTILQALEKEWPKLSDAAKVHFAEVLAGGKFQYERLLTFLNDYSGQYQRALKAIGDANAKQQEELVATTLTSPSKQWDMTKASMQSLSVTIMNQLTPSLIEFMTDLRQGTQYVNDHWNSIEKWISTGMKLAEAYVSWRLALATYNAVVKIVTLEQSKLNAAIAATTAEKEGFVAATATMGDSLLSLGAKAAAAAAKFAAFLAIFQSASSMISSANDPLDAKIKLTQAKLSTLNSQINVDEGKNASGLFTNNFIVDLFKDDMNPARAWKDSRFGASILRDTHSQELQQRAQLENELKGLQSQKDKVQADEVQKSLDNMNKIIADAQKNGGSVTGPVIGPPYMGPASGTFNPSVGSSSGGGNSKGSGASVPKGPTIGAQLKSLYDNLQQIDDDQLRVYTQRIDNASSALDDHRTALQNDESALKSNMSSTDAANALTKEYGATTDALKTHQNALAGETWEYNQLIPRVTADMKKLNDEYKAGKVTHQEYLDAMKPLQDEMDRLTKGIQDNQKAVAADNREMKQMAQDMQSDIIDELKAGYQEQQQIQQEALDNQYNAQKAILEKEKQDAKDASDVQVSALTAQKDAIDATINALQQQWSAQDENNKLLDLQNQFTNVMNDKRFEIVGTDGKLSYTYDQSKAADLRQQIADEQTTIQRNAEKQQLDDQKTALDTQIKNLQDASTAQQTQYDQQLTDLQNNYNKMKSDLDQYWQYKLTQDNLQQEADRKVQQDGFKKSLEDTQAYANQMIQLYNSIHAAAVGAGDNVSASLGSTQTSLSSPLHFATGGQVPLGAGIPGVDSVHALLTPGEWVIPEMMFDDVMSRMSMSSSSNTTQSFYFDKLELPNVTDAPSFIEELTAFTKQGAYHTKVG